MAPSRRKGASKAAAAAAARRRWKVGDLVLAKVKGFPAWPATVSEPEKWGYSSDWKKVLVYFFGTKQIAFCNPADVEEFTEEKRESLLGKRQGRGADFVRAVQEIVDCYDKLKEKNEVDQLSSQDAAAENAAVGYLNASNTTASNTTPNSTLNSPNTSKPKDEQAVAVEDVGALMEMEALQASEERADNVVAPSLPMPNTYTLRKKSRSMQPQRCANQTSRSPLTFDPHSLQNSVLKSSDVRSSGDGCVNGFWNGPLRRAKRSKRSPDGSGPSVGNSPICNSSGTVEHNGSEMPMADSENLSNSKGSAVESEHKLELSRGLDLQAKASVIRKKRNSARKRVQNDGLESSLRQNQEVSRDTGAQKDILVLPSCENTSDSHPKDEGDEHLPLVKRARVRMGKMLSEEQRQLDFLVKSEEKSLDSPLTSALREVNTSLNFNENHAVKNLVTANELIVCSPVDNCSQVSENEPQLQLQLQKTDSSIVDEPVAYALGNCAQVLESKPQPSKTKTSQPFGCIFDGEAALPPFKRLHRALEAMSANAAEESWTSVEVPFLSKIDTEGYHLPAAKSRSDMLGEDEADNNLESQNDSLNSDNALHDDWSGVSYFSNSSSCKVITKPFKEVFILGSSDRNLESVKVECAKDNANEMAVCTDNKGFSGSDSSGLSNNILRDQVARVILNNVAGPEPILGSLTTVLTQRPLKVFSKAGEGEMHESLMGNNRAGNELHSERGKNSIVGEEEMINAGCNDGTIVNLCDEEVNDLLKASVDENTKTSNTCKAVEEAKHIAKDVQTVASSSPLLNASSSQRTCYVASNSGVPSNNLNDGSKTTSIFPAHPNDLMTASFNNDLSPHIECHAAGAKLPHNKHVSDVAESKVLVTGIHHQSKSGERANIAEVKAALASLELTLGSLTRTKESIGRATRIAVDCLKFGVAAEVVERLALYLEKESSLYRRVDLFFLVDSIAQCSRGLKVEVGGAYISTVKGTLARMLSAAAPPGQAARENRRQCLKVLRLWLERRILPESIIRQHIRELDSLDCSSSTAGYSRRMSRTERSFDDPLRDMEGMLVDEYGSNSSFQLPGFCMPRMLKEEDNGSDSGGSFEAVTPERDSKNQEPHEVTVVAATEKHRHILEDVDGELEMEDVAPHCEVEMDSTASKAIGAAFDVHNCKEHFSSFVPPLPYDVPNQARPLATSPPPLPPLPPPPPPPAPPLVPHASSMSHLDVDSQLCAGRNSMQETMSSRPPAPGIHHSIQMPISTSSCSYNSYPLMQNPVAPGNNQPADANLYGKTYNLRPPYPSPSNQFSYFQADQVLHQRDAAPASCYGQSHFGHRVEGGNFYGSQDVRPPRHELTDSWAYSRPPFPSPTCEPVRPQNHGWAFPPRPMHHRNHIPSRPPCDGSVPVGARALGYWRPRRAL